MAEQNTQALRLKKPLPSFKVNEGAEMDPIDLNWYVESLTGKTITFTASLVDGSPLPDGVICTDDGAFGGTPEEGTASPIPYRLEFTAETDGDAPLVANTTLRIYDADHPIGETGFFLEEPEDLQREGESKLEDLAALSEDFTQYWKQYADGEAPDLQKALTRAITREDIYYLLSRYMTLTVWNADDLSVPTIGKVVTLKNASNKFTVYDFGVALVMTPTNLYAADRSLQNGIRTAKAMAKEVKTRGWDAELAGFDKLVTAFWVAVNQANRLDKGHMVQIRNYEPTATDYATLSHELKAAEQMGKTKG